MTQIIGQIDNTPDDIEVSTSLEIRKFLAKLALTLSYTPDKTSSDENRNENKLIDNLEGFRLDIENLFFNELYIDREERKLIEQYIPSKRLILLPGLAGVGKTVLLLRLAQEYKKNNTGNFIYLDLKPLNIEAMNNSLVDDNKYLSNLTEELFHAIYYRLSEEYIHKSATLIQEWLVFRIKNDINYSNIKEKILDIALRPLESDQEWIEILTRINGQSLLPSIQPSLTSLLRFINSKYPNTVLCLDNVDRFPLSVQRAILEQCIHISNSVEISVIMAIRYANLQRVISTGALGDVIFEQTLNEIRSKDYGNPIGGQVDIIGKNISVEALIKKRIDFIVNHSKYDPTNDLKEKANADTAAIDKYIENFWDLFKSITSFAESEYLFNYSNHNIRELMLIYFRFINYLIFTNNPETNLYYASTNAHRSLTILRTSFYRWLVCNGQALPSPQNGLPNIFELEFPGIRQLSYKTLSCIYNMSKDYKTPIKIADIANMFAKIGISREVVFLAIKNLTRNQFRNPNIFIWLDSEEIELINDATNLNILPAGQYFLETLSISREYTFWNALITDTEINLTGEDKKGFDYSNTYDEKFKLTVVMNFILKVLLPELVTETRAIAQKIDTPSQLLMSRIDYYLRIFSIQDSFYETRLVRSILNTISHSNLNHEQERKFNEQYLSALNELQTIRKNFAKREKE